MPRRELCVRWNVLKMLFWSLDGIWSVCVHFKYYMGTRITSTKCLWKHLIQILFNLQFNQDLYSSSGVPIAASSSTSAGSHSPCSPLLPPTLAAGNATQTSSTTIPTIVQRQHATKEEDLTVTRSDTEGNYAARNCSYLFCDDVWWCDKNVANV